MLLDPLDPNRACFIAAAVANILTAVYVWGREARGVCLKRGAGEGRKGRMDGRTDGESAVCAASTPTPTPTPDVIRRGQRMYVRTCALETSSCMLLSLLDGRTEGLSLLFGIFVLVLFDPFANRRLSSKATAAEVGKLQNSSSGVWHFTSFDDGIIMLDLSFSPELRRNVFLSYCVE